MAVDYFPALECAAKRQFGKGDCYEGAVEILERLKAKNRAETTAEILRQSGEDPSQATVTIIAPDRDGTLVEKDVTIAQLLAEAEALKNQDAACKRCPANFLDRPYGCFGVINYPIPDAAERWLIARVQPPGTLGADLCLAFLDKSKLTGEPVREMRKQGLLENTSPPSAPLKKGMFSGRSLSANQLLEAMLMSGQSLTPGRCFEILFWLGAIKVDGAVPHDADVQSLLQKLRGLKTPSQKREHTQLELGPDADSDDASPFAEFLKATYLAWVHNVPLQVSA